MDYPSVIPISLNTVKELVESGLADIIRNSLFENAESARELADLRLMDSAAKRKALDDFDAQIEAVKEEMEPILAKTIPQRMKRGEADKIIEKRLQESNGTGVTISGLMKKTGTKYTTTYRALHKLKKAHKAREEGSKWFYGASRDVSDY